jgi:hypothetical protein
MLRNLILVLCLCCCACSRQAHVVTTGSTDHAIPGDATPLSAAFVDEDGKHLYLVLVYGTRLDMRASPDHLLVRGQRVAVPAEGKVYVLDPKLNLHKTQVRPETLKAPLWEGGANAFFGTDAWTKDLHPLLKQHQWPKE